MSQDKIIISIEGNIGVGKSTFIDILKNNWDDCEVVYEPVEMWKELKDDNNKNILQIFYENINRWAYSFQNVACITRMMKIEDTIKNSSKKFIFLDRSLGTDSNVFEKMLYDSKEINEVEHKMYKLWCDFYFKYVRSNEQIINIYLKSDPEVCLDRIKKRGRVEESSITLDYLQKLDKYHNDWLLNNNNVVILDCNDDFESNLNTQQFMMKQIKDKLIELKQI